MRLLFAKHSLVWPRARAHDVHAYYMMKACAAIGHQVSLATAIDPGGPAIDGLPLAALFRLDAPANRKGGVTTSSWLQRRFRSFYGVPDSRVAALAHAAADSGADAVIVVGLDALPYFSGLSGVVRIWYAADEWMWHHLSQIRPGDRAVAANLRDAAIKGLYERAHTRLVDRVWVVSDIERRAMRWLAGMKHVDVLPNGVDGDYYRPGSEPVDEHTAVFWGRLDFGPNVQALEWFVRRVWPFVRRERPDARFTIIGFKPSATVRRLAAVDGVSLLADLGDLRSTVRRHAVAVLPFVSGGGIKNKLLEAAALARPIICTPPAIHGLRGVDRAPLLVCSKAHEMGRALLDLWSDAARQRQMGAAARSWVLKHHSWIATAREAIAALDDVERVDGAA
jgi:polysaccharide biosynthesis protein PslH